MSQMKKVIIALALAVGFTSNAQEVVYSDPDNICPFTIFDDGKMLVRMDNGKNTFYDFGSLENVLQLFENMKTETSTDQYTITTQGLGTVKLVFKDYQFNDKTISNKTEYYINPYLRKLIVKSINSYNQ
jgi:hypothetical protein